MCEGCAYLRGPEPGDPVPDVPPPHGLYGHAEQERAGGEEAVKVRESEGNRRHCHAVRHLSRGGTVRHGHLHAGGVRSLQQPDREQRETAAHPLLQISHQFFQKKQTLIYTYMYIRLFPVKIMYSIYKHLSVLHAHNIIIRYAYQLVLTKNTQTFLLEGLVKALGP